MNYFRTLTLDKLAPKGEDRKRVITWKEAAEYLEQELLHYFSFEEISFKRLRESSNNEKAYCLRLILKGREYETKIQMMSIKEMIQLRSAPKPISAVQCADLLEEIIQTRFPHVPFSFTDLWENSLQDYELYCNSLATIAGYLEKRAKRDGDTARRTYITRYRLGPRHYGKVLEGDTGEERKRA